MRRVDFRRHAGGGGFRDGESPCPSLDLKLTYSRANLHDLDAFSRNGSSLTKSILGEAIRDGVGRYRFFSASLQYLGQRSIDSFASPQRLVDRCPRSLACDLDQTACIDDIVGRINDAFLQQALTMLGAGKLIIRGTADGAGADLRNR